MIKVTIYAAADHIMRHGPKHKKYGICHSMNKTPVKGTSDINFTLELRPYFKTWKHYTGHPGYPIPTKPLTRWQRFKVKYLGSIVGDPIAAYAYAHCNNKWDKDTEYGQLRWDLLKHIIKETA